MSNDTLRCGPPEEACGHAIGTCVCDQAPVEEGSEPVEPCRCGAAGCPDTKRLNDARALWSYRVVHECYRLGRRAPLASPENVIVEEAKLLVASLPAETRASLGACP